MATLGPRTVRSILLGVLAALQGVASAQTHDYRWLRTDQELGTQAIVTVTAQGDTANNDSDRVITTTQDQVFVERDAWIERPAFGGEGGGGGDSFELHPWAFSGDNGQQGFPFDGADGAPNSDYSGRGGRAGSDGTAYAAGTTLGDGELNPDFQAVLGYSWIHNQWGDVELVGAGGGGGGGGGSHMWDDQEAEFYWGADGGNGDNARGIVVCTQASDVFADAVCVNTGTGPNNPRDITS